jgi:hypothetical protein
MRTFLRRRLWTALLALAGVVAPAAADDSVRLEERFAAGYQYHVSTRVDLTGTLTPPAVKGQPAPKPLRLRGDSAIDYDERILDAADGQVRKTVRRVGRMEFRRTVGDRPQETSLRRAVSRLVLLRKGSTEVPFSPDGPLLWGEIDLVRTDVFTPALAGLLPPTPVRPGDRWPVSTAAVQELTDMERIEEGKLECRLEQVTTIEKRRHARVAFEGEVRGTNEDGPGRQRLSGYFFFDLESNHLSYLYLNGRHALLDGDGKEAGRVEGRFVLTRQVLAHIADLSDEALRGVVLEPNTDNTRLLYDNPDLGVRFLHPRRWRVAGVRGSQVALDSADGSGLLVTLDPVARVPTGAAFLAESRDWLEKQKAKLVRTEPPRAVQAGLEQFALEAEMGGQKFLMDYYVSRQALGGATLAARLLPADLAALRQEVEGIARSLAVTRKIEERGGRP